jgi:co-chaperonin GroES (HSP10)
MRPLNGYVFVKEVQNNGDVTPAGIKLPDTLELQYEIGAVLSVRHYQKALRRARKPGCLPREQRHPIPGDVRWRA